MITVMGGSGFIGSQLVAYLAANGIEHQVTDVRAAIAEGPLGTVIYCVGVTGDFRARPHDAVEAHVSRVNELIRTCSFDAFVYLSSTRVYGRGHEAARETDLLTFDAADAEDLYGLSKAMGEAVVLTTDRGRVVRLANVYGSDVGLPGFLSVVLRDAVTRAHVDLETTLESERDYVSVVDVVELLTRIALHGSRRVYNVASGRNTSNGELVAALAHLTGAQISVAPGAHTVVFRPIDVSLVQQEFDFRPAMILDDLPRITAEAQARLA